MKMLIVGYYDKKLNVFTAPTTISMSSTDDLIESTRRLCANPKLPKVYLEYDLYKFGTYDDKLGVFELEVKPEFVCSLADFKHLAESGEENVAQG